MPIHPLADYLADCRARHRTGAVTPETSYYGPFETLINAVGHKLKKPKVFCFMSLGNEGGNMPDGGLFTQDQIPRGNQQPIPGQKPSRGAIEAKPFAKKLERIRSSQQFRDYWNEHHQVLITNVREFALYGMDNAGQPVLHEIYRLAATAEDFWQLSEHPESAVREHGERLLQFLERCLRRPAALTDPKDVAWFLASYARDARERVEHSQAHKQVEVVRKALEQALGLKVEDEKGAHFFQSTLVQTLFYGLFSAWVLWHRTSPGTTERFDWEKASRYLHVPILRKLFRELTDPAHLDEWDNLTEVMGWAADTLNRVQRETFFQKFREAEAVQYFYEPFLEAFDPQLRKQLGVWYTPPEIVKYMVARVDQVLKSDFDKPDGLADEDVYILDPCCGTGAFLVETLSVIAATLAEQGEGATLAGKLKKAASSRVIGFEILPAPFVVAHLQMGIFLQSHGATFEEKRHERASVFLTNALTGWKPPVGPKQKLVFPEMEQERDAADKIKQQTPILVVIGNPPYNGFAGLPVAEEAGLVEPYRFTKSAPKPQGQGLNDLYVRFFRVAERCVTERAPQYGIVCYISNYSWLDGLSHTGMRERFLEEFDDIWIDSLNGDKYKTGKTTPEGKPDPSVFSTPQNREGIQVGTAVALLSRKPQHDGPANVNLRDFWGESKREELVESLKAKSRETADVKPLAALGLTFRMTKSAGAYSDWPLLVELFPVALPGVQSKQDQLVTDIDETRLRERIEDFFNSKLSDDLMEARHPRSMDGHSGCDQHSTRGLLQKRGVLNEYYVPYLYRPFDLRTIYWEPTTNLLGRKSPELFPLLVKENLFIEARKKEALDVWRRGTVVTALPDNFGNGFSNFIPMLLMPSDDDASWVTSPDTSRRIGKYDANVSDAGQVFLASHHGIDDYPALFHHAISAIHSPAYARENASALLNGWPRVPLPAQRKQLLASAALGRRLAALLDPKAEVNNVTTGKLPPHLKCIAVPTRADGGNFSGDDFALTARWGITGKGGVTMPAKGRVEVRPYDAKERAAMADAIPVLGESTCDIYLNDECYWKNIPVPVWEYTLGGYQVLKKWLSYRECSILGRPLTVDEVDYFRDVARRIATLLLLGPELDANYAAVKADLYSWAGTSESR